MFTLSKDAQTATTFTDRIKSLEAELNQVVAEFELWLNKKKSAPVAKTPEKLSGDKLETDVMRLLSKSPDITLNKMSGELGRTSYIIAKALKSLESRKLVSHKASKMHGQKATLWSLVVANAKKDGVLLRLVEEAA
jgi:hypothetical protein